MYLSVQYSLIKEWEYVILEYGPMIYWYKEILYPVVSETFENFRKQIWSHIQMPHFCPYIIYSNIKHVSSVKHTQQNTAITNKAPIPCVYSSHFKAASILTIF